VRGEVRGRKLELRMLRMKGDLFTVVVIVVGGCYLVCLLAGIPVISAVLYYMSNCWEVYPQVNCVYFWCNDEYHCYDTLQAKITPSVHPQTNQTPKGIHYNPS